MVQLELRWHGHACFALKCKEFTVVFDPYEDNYVRGFGALDVAADLVLCSHTQHSDHNARHVVKPLEGHENPFTVTAIETFHDPEGGALRGRNTIHVLQAGNLKVAHFGDLGCELTPAQLADLQGLDVAMIPIGGYYTIATVARPNSSDYIIIYIAGAESNANLWQPLQIKGTLTPATFPGAFDLTWIQPSLVPISFEASATIDGDLLSLAFPHWKTSMRMRRISPAQLTSH